MELNIALNIPANSGTCWEWDLVLLSRLILLMMMYFAHDDVWHISHNHGPLLSGNVLYLPPWSSSCRDSPVRKSVQVTMFIYLFLKYTNRMKFGHSLRSALMTLGLNFSPPTSHSASQIHNYLTRCFPVLGISLWGARFGCFSGLTIIRSEKIGITLVCGSRKRFREEIMEVRLRLNEVT